MEARHSGRAAMPRRQRKRFVIAFAWAMAATTGHDCATAADRKPPPREALTQFDWTGLYVGGHLDASFPGFPRNDISIGGISIFSTPDIGLASYSENVLHFGTLRGRVGYAPANWLFYATGGFAWTYNQLTLTQLADDTTDSPFLWRLGWVAGLGVEWAFAPNWTVNLEYLYTKYGNSSVMFPNAGLQFTSDLSLQQARASLNYRFGGGGTNVTGGSTGLPTPDLDLVNFHGQTTFVWQGYPAIRSPYAGPNSLPGSGLGRETFDATLYAGIRLWQ